MVGKSGLTRLSFLIDLLSELCYTHKKINKQIKNSESHDILVSE